MKRNSRAGRTPAKYYAVIPTPEGLSPEEKVRVERGGPYPVRVRAYLPEHEDFLDFLIDVSLNEWSGGGGVR
jgi:hypothetical protein